MQKRHDDQIWNCLDQLYVNGSVFMSWGDLYYWYNIERIAKLPWRDIQGKWQQLLEEEHQKYTDPLVAEVNGGVTLFFSKKHKKLSEYAR